MIDDIDGVRARLALNGQQDAWYAVDPVSDVLILNTIGHGSDLIEPHWRAIAISDD